MRFGVIGNDQMVISCIQILQKIPGVTIPFVFYDPGRLNPMNPIDSLCTTQSINARSIKKLNDPEIIEIIKSHEPDYILSINNFWVIGEKILAIPSGATINFHNSVPSKYHGLNIPSWVIMNGEKTHGAMWHFVEPTIDTGAVIAFEEFALSERETAASLMVKCIKKGIDMFPGVINQALTGNFTRTLQGKNSSYFGKKDYPESKGYIDFNLSYDAIDRLVRGLNYTPYKNTYLCARLKYGERELIINSVELIRKYETTTPGKIVLTDEDNFQVECKDGLLNIIDATDESQNTYEGAAIADYFNTGTGAIIISRIG